MKKLVSVIVLLSLLFAYSPIFAADSFIELDPYPYSTHVLGEDLVICGDTDFGQVTLGLFYPDDEQGYHGYAKYIMTIDAEDLKNGYVIPTETKSRLWPTGLWKVVVQNGSCRDEIFINMQTEAEFDLFVRIAEYENSSLTKLTTYPCRGVVSKNGILSFTTMDGTTVKIFTWNNFAPTVSGEARIFIATYTDGYLTDTRTFQGTLSRNGYHLTLNISENKSVGIFIWSEQLNPLN